MGSKSTKSQEKPSCTVIGAGPAGLMAAEHLAKAGIAVTVYDQMPTVGRKFLMAGRGGLNLTHSEAFPLFLSRYGDAAPWLKAAIEAFPPEALRKWSEDLGQKTFIGTSGRIFPESLKASPLLRAWLKSLEKLGVRFALQHRWCGWTSDKALSFSDSKGRSIQIQSDAVILALGGASWPRLGSDGSWTDILSADGIKISTLKAANCGFIVPWSKIFSDRFAGSPLKPVKVSFENETLQGEALITQKGIEGSAIYALSRPLRETIEKKGEAILSIDLRPGLSPEDILKRLKTPKGSQSTTSYLRKAVGLSPVALGIMRECVPNAILPTSEEALVKLIKGAPLRLTETSSIKRAISSAGGIAREELTKDFMIKKRPGLFAIGEMLDWEAPTGGYLLQATFSMAVKAATGVEKYLADKKT